MARKLDTSSAKGKRATGKAPPSAAPAPDEGSDDAVILHPDLTVTIAGREITVREYRFVDGLRVRAKSRALVQDLYAQIAMGEALTEDVMDVLAKHHELVRELIVEATEGADREWFDGLDEKDGNLLMLAWWTVCGPFFVQQIARRIGQAIEVKKVLVGLTSSMHSPGPGTEQPTSSVGATPTAS